MALFSRSALKFENGHLTRQLQGVQLAVWAKGEDFKKFLDSLEVEARDREETHSQSRKSLIGDLRKGTFAR